VKPPIRPDVDRPVELQGGCSLRLIVGMTDERHVTVEIDENRLVSVIAAR